MANSNNKKKQLDKSSMKFTFWMIGLVAVAILAFIFLGNHANKDENANPKEAAAIDYTDQPFLGNESAPVSIIEFGDYKCPACKDFDENFLPIILKELVDTGKAKLYFMNYSFINIDSERSAKFAESVFHELGNETFWKFHDLLFEKQPADEKADVFTEKFLIDTLKEIADDQDVDKVVNDFKAKKSDDAWQKDMDYGKKLGVTGTPTLFVNGKRFEGNSLDDLADMVDQAAKEK